MNKYFFTITVCLLPALLMAQGRVVPSPTKTRDEGRGTRDASVQKLTIGSATAAVKALDRQLSEYRIGKNLTDEDQEWNRKLKQKILRGTFDIRELTKRAMAKHWDVRTPQEQDELVELLTSVLEEVSVSAKEASAKRGEGKDYAVRYLGDRPLAGKNGIAYVKTVVHLPKERLDVKIEYELKKMENGWRIYDVMVDEASLVANYRYSFNKIIKEHGYPELVRRLRKKLDEVRNKNSNA